MPEQFNVYDPTDLLRSEEDIAYFLQDAQQPPTSPEFIAKAHEIASRARARLAEGRSDKGSQ